MSQVKVIAHPESGNVITPSSKNPEYGTFRVDSENRSLENGFVNISKRTAFIRGKISDLETLGLRAGQVLPGRIQKRESFDPFYDDQEPKINPSTNEVILTNGQESYLEYVYTSDVKASDVWVDNAEAEELTEEAKAELAKQAV